MTTVSKIISAAAGVLALIVTAGCSVDNMDAPDCHVYGKVGWRDASGTFIPLGVKGSGNGAQSRTVVMEIWQGQWGKEAAQDMNVGQDGSFSSYVYPGYIRVIPRASTGPWKETTDSVKVTVKGDTQIEFEVTPYFMVANAEFSYNATDKVLDVAFDLLQPDEEAELASIGVLFNERQFVDLTYCNYTYNISGAAPGHIEASIPLQDVSSVEGKRSLYARVFVKSKQSSQAAYSTTPYQLW